MQIDITKFKSFPRFKKRFLSHFPENAFQPGQENECWEWQGYKETTGYGRIYWGNKRYGAHQIAYLIFNGLIPKENIVVRHTCDNKLCVNPKHLILGTNKDNCIDTAKRNLQFKSELNLDDVKIIKWLVLNKYRYGILKKLASFYGVSKYIISDIRRSHTWSWVIPEEPEDYKAILKAIGL